MAGLWSSRKVHVLEEMSGGWREGQKKEGFGVTSAADRADKRLKTKA